MFVLELNNQWPRFIADTQGC